MPDHLAWEVARAGGLTAYALLWAATVVGLALGMRWRSRVWPRFVTAEVHRFLSLASLTFTAVHVAALSFDPFMAFVPAELLVPMVSHYRPLWMALGIVGAYLVLAIWLSDLLRPRIGYVAWRRLHYLTFAGFALAFAHGVTTGTDTRAAPAVAVYATTGGVFALLLMMRLALAGVTGRRRASLAVAAGLGVACVGVLLAVGPFQTGWNEIANNGNGNGSRLDADAVTTSVASPAPGQFADFAGSFVGSLEQRLRADGSLLVTVSGELGDGAEGTLVLEITEQQIGEAFRVTGTRLALELAGEDVCVGGVTTASEDRIHAVCAQENGQVLNLGISLQASRSDIRGTIAATLVRT